MRQIWGWMGLGVVFGVGLAAAAEAPVGMWKTIDEKKDKPIVGLVIVKDLKADGDRFKGGTILDPEDGKVYKAEIWVEDGKLKVRGYLGGA